MKRASSFAVSSLAMSLLAVPLLPVSPGMAASAGVPDLNVQAICKTRDANAKLFHSTTGQSIDECVHDEDAARQQLGVLWTTVALPIRNRCQSEARALGTTSYLDLVTCMQMAEDLKEDIKTTPKTRSDKE